MPDPKDGKEQYTPEGRTIVDDSVFDDPGTETPAETTPADTTPADTTPQDTTPKEGEDTTPADDTPEDTTPEGDEPGEGEDTPPKGDDGKDNPPEQLLAGKFKTEDELKKAYQNLGGDPAKHKTIQSLVEAYEYRNSEFTRVSQEEAERQRLAALIPDNTGKDKLPNSQVTVDDLMKKVDWTKVTDAQTLGQQLFTIMLENMPKAQPQQMTPQQLVETVMPLMKEREEKQKALSDIEGEVPRLKTDMAFRKAFAYHVVGGKSDGSKYPRTKAGLQEAMKDFLAWGKSIADESSRQTQIQTKAKKSAQAPRETGAETPPGGGKQMDEADEIISAYAEKQKKFGK